MSKKKLVVLAGALLFLGSTVGFAAGLGFFDNAKIVENNIYKLSSIATQNKQKAEDLQSKLDKTASDEKNLQEQLANLNQQLVNKQNELNSKQGELTAKQGEIEAKQREIEAKQQEVNQKQQDADNLRNQLNQVKSESDQKDQRIAELANLSQQKVDELSK